MHTTTREKLGEGGGEEEAAKRKGRGGGKRPFPENEERGGYSDAINILDGRGGDSAKEERRGQMIQKTRSLSLACCMWTMRTTRLAEM